MIQTDLPLRSWGMLESYPGRGLDLARDGGTMKMSDLTSQGLCRMAIHHLRGVLDGTDPEKWTDLAANAITCQIQDFESEIQVADNEAGSDQEEEDELSGLAEAYRAEDEAASRRPGAARLSSTLRSEIGYEDQRR